jgi:hypothetical protein
MNWQAIGAIGEIIGGIAVIATLVYLALQLRQYSLGVNSATIQQNMIAFNELNRMLVDDPSLAEAFERGTTDPGSLSDEDSARYLWLLRSYVNLYENLYEQYRRGTCPEDFWRKNALELKDIADRPGLRLFRQQNAYHDELFNHIDEMRENPDRWFSFNLRSGGDST